MIIQIDEATWKRISTCARCRRDIVRWNYHIQRESIQLCIDEKVVLIFDKDYCKRVYETFGKCERNPL